MAGLVPAIHVFFPAAHKDVDARDERGHDAAGFVASINFPSWPDLFRRSTSFFWRLTKDVDARDERGHDEAGFVAGVNFSRHGRTCSGHPRLYVGAAFKRRGCPRRARA
jgi:hypothetical protein